MEGVTFSPLVSLRFMQSMFVGTWNDVYRKIFGYSRQQSVKYIFYGTQMLDFIRLYDVRK